MGPPLNPPLVLHTFRSVSSSLLYFDEGTQRQFPPKYIEITLRPIQCTFNSNSNKLLYLHDRIIVQYYKSMRMTIKI